MYPRELVDDYFTAATMNAIPSACIAFIRSLIGSMSLELVLSTILRNEGGGLNNTSGAVDGMGVDDPEHIISPAFMRALAKSWNHLIADMELYCATLGFVPIVIMMKRRGEEHKPARVPRAYTEDGEEDVGADDSGLYPVGVNGRQVDDDEDDDTVGAYDMQIPEIIIPSYQTLDFGVSTDLETGTGQYVCKWRDASTGHFTKSWSRRRVGGIDDILTDVQFLQFTSTVTAGYITSPIAAIYRDLQTLQTVQRHRLVASGAMAMPLVTTQFTPSGAAQKLSYEQLICGENLVSDRTKVLVKSVLVGQAILGDQENGPYAPTGQSDVRRMMQDASLQSSMLLDGLSGGVGAVQTAPTPAEHASRVAVIHPDLMVTSGPQAAAAKDTMDIIVYCTRSIAGRMGVPVSVFMPGMSHVQDSSLVESTVATTEHTWRTWFVESFEFLFLNSVGLILANRSLAIQRRNKRLFQEAVSLRLLQSRTAIGVSARGRGDWVTKSRLGMAGTQRVDKNGVMGDSTEAVGHESFGHMTWKTTVMGDVIRTPRRVQKKRRRSKTKAGADEPGDAEVVEGKEGKGEKGQKRVRRMGGGGDTGSGSGSETNPSSSDTDDGSGEDTDGGMTDERLAEMIRSRAARVARMYRRQMLLDRCGVQVSFDSYRDYLRQREAFERGLIPWSTLLPSAAAAIGVSVEQMNKKDPEDVVFDRQQKHREAETKQRVALAIWEHGELEKAGVTPATGLTPGVTTGKGKGTGTGTGTNRGAASKKRPASARPGGNASDKDSGDAGTEGGELSARRIKGASSVHRATEKISADERRTSMASNA